MDASVPKCQRCANQDGESRWQPTRAREHHAHDHTQHGLHSQHKPPPPARMPNYVVEDAPRPRVDDTPYAKPLPLREQISRCVEQWDLTYNSESSDGEDFFHEL